MDADDRYLMDGLMAKLTPGQILTDAGKLLEGGWCTGSWIIKGHAPNSMVPVRRFCSMGAINMVSLGMAYTVYDTSRDYLHPNLEARAAAVRALAEQVNPDAMAAAKRTVIPLGTLWAPTYIVTGWNDHLDHTQQDEVLHQFELAAKLANQ